MSNDMDAARKTYAAVLHALDVATRWQTQEATQAETEYTQMVQAAETRRKQAEEGFAKLRAGGTKHAEEMRTLVEDAVKRGETLYLQADLNKHRPQSLPAPRPLVPALPPEQALHRAMNQAVQAANLIQAKLSELEQARRDNFLETRRFIIAGAIVVAVVLVIIILLAARN